VWRVFGGGEEGISRLRNAAAAPIWLDLDEFGASSKREGGVSPRKSRSEVRFLSVVHICAVGNLMLCLWLDMP